MQIPGPSSEEATQVPESGLRSLPCCPPAPLATLIPPVRSSPHPPGPRGAFPEPFPLHVWVGCTVPVFQGGRRRLQRVKGGTLRTLECSPSVAPMGKLRLGSEGRAVPRPRTGLCGLGCTQGPSVPGMGGCLAGTPRFSSSFQDRHAGKKCGPQTPASLSCEISA